VNHGGGTPITLATGQGNAVKVPISGGAITTLATGQGATTAVALDADNVYWVGFSDSRVMMRSK